MFNRLPAGGRARRRHGNSSAQLAITPRGLRRRLRLIAVLPALVVMPLLMLAAYALSVRTVHVWVIWSGTTIGCVFATGVAWWLSETAADTVGTAQAHRRAQEARSVTELRDALPVALKDIQAVAEQVRRGEEPQIRPVPPADPADNDGLTCLSSDLGRFVYDVELCLAEHWADQDRTALLVLGRRMRSLTTKALAGFDALEGQVEDPDLLGPLFRLDHQVTRVRRFADSLIIVGDGEPREQRQPEELATVIQHAETEIEQYYRVATIPPFNPLVLGRISVSLVHLLAELMDNAARFSHPDLPVTVRATQVPAGVAIEVEDRGAPIPASTMDRLNQLLADPSSQYTRENVRDGRLGLWCVSKLAHRYGLHVQLQVNAYGSNSAVVIVPSRHLLPPAEREAGRPASVSPPRVHTPEHPTESTLALPVVTVGEVPSAGPSLTGPTSDVQAQQTPPHAGPGPNPHSSPTPESSGGRARLPKREPSKSYIHPKLLERPETEAPMEAPRLNPNLGHALTAVHRRAAERDASQPPQPMIPAYLEDDRDNHHQ